MGGRDSSNKELGAVGVLSRKSGVSLRTWGLLLTAHDGKPTCTSIGHGEKERLLMLDREAFVVELVAVDGFAAGAIALGKVTTLDHELLDDAVEEGALEMEGLAGATDALFTSAERAEVFGRLGDKIIVELHDDATDGPATEAHVEEDLGALGGGLAFGSHFDCCW